MFLKLNWIKLFNFVNYTQNIEKSGWASKNHSFIFLIAYFYCFFFKFIWSKIQTNILKFLKSCKCWILKTCEETLKIMFDLNCNKYIKYYSLICKCIKVCITITKETNIYFSVFKYSFISFPSIQIKKNLVELTSESI